MKSVLAFDQALGKMGYAFGTTESGPVAAGLVDTRPRRFDSLGMRYIRFEKAVRDLIAKYQPTLIVFEEHRMHQGIIAAQVLGSCAAIIMKCAAEANVPHTTVLPNILKKHATGHHRASKELMVAVARKKYPTMTVLDDNVADALHMMRWGLDQL